MNSFSKIKEIIKWCFRPDENSPKHSQWSHPLFSFIFGVGVTLIPLIKLSDYLEQSFPDLKGQFSSWTQGNLPIALIFYIVLTILSRMKYFGPSALYDFLWACNISILIMIVGLLKQSYLLISSSMILVAIDQVK